MIKLLLTLILANSFAFAGERNLYWGDTHLHTSNSFDTFLFGTVTSTPDTAYRFAKGLPVVSPTTQTRMQLATPLDFLVVADHAEALGTAPRVFAGDPDVADTKTGRVFLEIAGDLKPNNLNKLFRLLLGILNGAPNEYNLTAKDLYNDIHAGEKRRTPWQEYLEAADRHNEPGVFTSLIGWEWTSAPGGANLHRVIFTPEDSEVANRFLPYSALESPYPEDLWKWLEETSKNTGADFVAIPHNPNISMGKMFPLVTMKGAPVDAQYAAMRMRWEPVVEVTQIKGDSEAHPSISPTDEFADYEIYTFTLTPDGRQPPPTKGDYLRSGLMRGLLFEEKIGLNPYKVGMIGSTDSHTGMSAVEENNFGGKSQHDARPEDRPHKLGLGELRGWDMGAAGFVGVWAEKNTRQDIFDAFKRKEVYASTGPRISLRFFGGWDFNHKDAKARDLPSIGYSKGVPMGGDLTNALHGKAPTFLIEAIRDPKEGNLDRVQVIKGWVGIDGKAHEKIYDVAWSGYRSKNPEGKLPPVGNTVDLSTGNYTNTIGSPELSTVWRDPDFNRHERSFYYVRVLQIPTPRYSLLDSIALKIDPKETGHPATIQERAYSSPIWYSP